MDLCQQSDVSAFNMLSRLVISGEGNGHSSILAWLTPWTEEPGGLQSMGSQKSWTQLGLAT